MLLTHFFGCSCKETLAPLYHSGAAGGPGGPKCSPCESTKLICQTPLSVSDDAPCTFPAPEVKISVPVEAPGKTSEEEEEANGERTVEDPNRGRGEPQEVSEEEEVHGGFRLLNGSCTCAAPVRQPLEVGENEDCSQAVSPGTPGICSCGSESRKEESAAATTVGDKSFGNGDRMLLSKRDTAAAAAAPLVSSSSPLTRSSSSPPRTPPSEPGPRPRRVQPGIASPPLADSSPWRRESDGPTSPKTTSPSEANVDLSPEQSRGLSCRDSGGSTLSSAEAQLECSPESLHSQLTEPDLTSGWSTFQHPPQSPYEQKDACVRSVATFDSVLSEYLCI